MAKREKGMGKAGDLHAGLKNRSPAGGPGEGDKSLSWAGGHTIDNDATRSDAPSYDAPGPRTA